MNDLTSAVAGSVAGLSPIGFLSAKGRRSGELRTHILDQVIAALAPAQPRVELDHSAEAEEGRLDVSLFANLPGDVLLGFDLSDRGAWRQLDGEGRALIAGFQRILVPGQWSVNRLMEDSRLGLRPGQVVAVGAPRIDELRRLQALRAESAATAPLNILYAPLHDHWQDGQGPLNSWAEMEPHLERLADYGRLQVIRDPRNKVGKHPITEALLEADVVITDCTSLIFEAWALRKPVILLSWLVGERVIKKVGRSAEAHIFRHGIGHHATGLDDVLNWLAEGRALSLGAGVESFMREYLSNWEGPEAAASIARTLERLADPAREARLKEARAAADEALTLKDWDQAAALLAQLLQWAPEEASLYDLYAKALNGQRKFWQEIEVLEQLTRMNPSAGVFYRLSEALRQMRAWPASAEALRQAIALRGVEASADWYYRLGYALEQSGDSGEQAYAQACALDDKSQSARFGVGAWHVVYGRWQEAKAAYRAQLILSPFDAELHYRLGMAHDRSYEWAEAEACYLAALSLEGARPTWQGRLAFVLERQSRWEEAAAAYLRAYQAHKAPQAALAYGAGRCWEQAGQLEKALAAYVLVHGPRPAAPLGGYERRLLQAHLGVIDAALAQAPDRADYWSRRASVLEALGDLSQAAQAVEQEVLCSPILPEAAIARHGRLTASQSARALLEARLAQDARRPEDWLYLARLAQEAGDLPAALGAVEQAIWRTPDFDGSLYHRKGSVLWAMGRLSEACDAFRQQMLIQRPHGAYEDRFAKDARVRFHAMVREVYDLLPVLEETILYEVHLGASMGCNPLPIFEALLARPGYENWRHIWVLDDLDKVPTQYRGRKNIFFVARGSDLYVRFLATCKILVNNGTFPEWFVRKPDQLYLNTWHGTPMKTLGSHMQMPVAARANTTRNFLQSTHMIFPNAHTRWSLIEGHNLQHIPCGPRELICGYPRNDRLVDPDPQLRAEILAELGLDPAKPVVLYAPTYRGSWNSPDLEAEAIIEELRRLAGDGYSLVFRGHHLVERKLGELDLPVATAPQRIDTNRLLGAVDVLISDYSSIIYDFMVLKRPVIQYVHDFDAYATDRGLYFTREEMPGRICVSVEEVRSAIADAVRDPQSLLTPSYWAAHEAFCAAETGRAAEQALDFLFQGDVLAEMAQERAAFGEKAVVMRSALGTINGVASSALALAHNLVENDHPLVFALEGAEIRKAGLGDEVIRDLETKATLLIRTGGPSLTLEEQWLLSKYNTDGLLGAPEMFDRLIAGFAHENARIFGHQSFRLAVDHQGYHPLWALILAQTPAQSRAIYLHNDMMLEAESRLPNLRRIFTLYDRYDHLIGVSESSAQANAERLVPIFPKTEGRYHYVRNGLNIGAIHDRAAQDLPEDADLARMRADEGVRLVNLARLSPEKNQALLLDAMKILQQSDTPISLYILGEGPLQQKLESQITALGLEGRVHLLGAKRNPFPFLQLGDAHVLSSSYEGQGIVLLEAMTLGVPCVSTDIPGPQSVLADGLGLLVPQTAEAMAEGIRALLTGEFEIQPFDAEAYNLAALQDFCRATGLGETVQ